MTQQHSRTFDNTLGSCNEFAMLFHNTCADDLYNDNEIAGNIAVLEGFETVECEYTGPNCVDTGTRATGSEECSYNRKLCVRCTTTATLKTDGTDEENAAVNDLETKGIKINVQANGLPLNCFYGFNQVVEQNMDFSVIWNPRVNSDRVSFSQRS